MKTRVAVLVEIEVDAECGRVKASTGIFAFLGEVLDDTEERIGDALSAKTAKLTWTKIYARRA